MTSYTKLESQFKKISALNHMMSIAGWDQQVMMPEGGVEARAEAQSQVAGLMHQMVVDPRVADWLNDAETKEWSQLSDWQQANVREIKRAYTNSRAVPEELVERLAKMQSLSQQKWGPLRAENNWKDFLPTFSELLQLIREVAAVTSEATGKYPYDALIDAYDPGFNQDLIEQAFAPLRKFLPNLIQEVIEKQKSEPVISPRGTYPIEKQKDLGLELMSAVGFDFKHGRLDVSLHPFCGGVPQDVRLTTAYNTKDFTESLMGVLHETGHARYEQGLPKEWLSQPVGTARGMSIHEGQSLLFEMQMSRSPQFLKFAVPIMKKHLGSCGDGDDFWQYQNIARLYTRVERGFIRVHSDEVTYPAHILLRFEAEKQMISGRLEAKDLPEFWDEQMQSLLGLSTKGNYKYGCMQDIHWPSGAIGYFPSYTLGAMTAAQLYQTACKENPSIPNDIEKGDFSKLMKWLGEKVWSQGSKMSSPDLLKAATGETLNPNYFEKHLRQRYL